MAEVIAKPHPRVGIAAVIHNGKGDVILGLRKGSHGAGTYQFPGGHLEHGETFSECVIREAWEETGLVLDEEGMKILATTNDVFVKEGKHYITIFMLGKVKDGEDTDPVVKEPEKCESWTWTSWDSIWESAKQHSEAEAQGKEPEKRMFLPIVSLYRQYPGLENCLGGI